MEHNREKMPSEAKKKRHWIWISVLVLAVAAGSALRLLDIPHITVKQQNGSMVITVGKEQKRQASPLRQPDARSWDESQTLDSFSREIAPSVVTVLDAQEEQDFGIIVSRNGYIVTGIRPLAENETLTVRLCNGQQYLARLVEQDEANNLLLLKIDASDLTPVRFSGGFRPESQPTEVMGLTVDEIPHKVRIFFSLPHGIHVQAVEDGSAAMECGLRPGDMITAVDDTVIRDPEDFCPTAQTEVKLTVFRDGSYRELLFKTP